MRGFTLIETIIYIAISTMLCTSLLSLAYTLTTTQAKISTDTQNELAGLYWLRAFDTAVHVHEIKNLDAAIHLQPFIKNILISTSTASGTSSISFTIDSLSFNLTAYEK